MKLGWVRERGLRILLKLYGGGDPRSGSVPTQPPKPRGPRDKFATAEVTSQFKLEVETR